MSDYMDKFVRKEEIRVRDEIITQVVKDMTAGNKKLSLLVDGGEEGFIKSPRRLIKIMNEHYQCRISLAIPSEGKWIIIEYSEPEITLYDYSSNLQEILKTSIKLVDKYS